MQNKEVGYDISELKQITESSNIQADADPNKMHFDSMRHLAETCDSDEADIIIDILAKRYPGKMFKSLSDRLDHLEGIVKNVSEAVK